MKKQGENELRVLLIKFMENTDLTPEQVKFICNEVLFNKVLVKQ